MIIYKKDSFKNIYTSPLELMKIFLSIFLILFPIIAGYQNSCHINRTTCRINKGKFRQKPNSNAQYWK